MLTDQRNASEEEYLIKRKTDLTNLPIGAKCRKRNGEIITLAWKYMDCIGNFTYPRFIFGSDYGFLIYNDEGKLYSWAQDGANDIIEILPEKNIPEKSEICLGILPMGTICKLNNGEIGTLLWSYKTFVEEKNIYKYIVGFNDGYGVYNDDGTLCYGGSAFKSCIVEILPTELPKSPVQLIDEAFSLAGIDEEMKKKLIRDLPPQDKKG